MNADTEKCATEWAAAGELPFEVVPAERDRLARQARALAKGGRTVMIDTPPNDREVLRAAAAVADRGGREPPEGDARGTPRRRGDEGGPRHQHPPDALGRTQEARPGGRGAPRGFPLLGARIRALTRYEDGFGGGPTYLEEYEGAWKEVVGG